MHQKYYTRQLGLMLAAMIVLLLASPPTGSAATDATLWDSATAKVEAGDLTAAKTLFTQLLQVYPTSPKAPGAQLEVARIGWKSGSKSDAELISAFAEVRTKYPSTPEATDALVHMGYLRSKSNTAQAIADFTQILKEDPDHPRAAGVQQSLGRLYLKAKDLDKAEATFDKVKTTPGASATVIDEANLQSCFVKIMRYHATKDKAHLTGAIDALSKMSMSPRLNTRARADLGIAEALLLQGKALDARAKYRAAAQVYASNSYFRGFALYGAAICSQEAHDQNAAIDDYTAFLNAQSGTTLAEKHTSWRVAALKSTSEKAQIMVQQKNAWGRLPASDAVQQSACLRGECLYMTARYTEAAQQFEEVMRAFPDTEIAKQATAALKRCRMAKGGK